MTLAPRKEKLWFLDTLVTIHLSATTNADRISVIEHRAPYGSSPPLHIHQTEDEAFHVLAGEARFVVDGVETDVKAGDTFVALKGVPHTFIVTSQEGAAWLTVTSRGDFETMVRATGRPAEHAGLPPPVGQPEPAQIAVLEAACRAHGIDLIGPPMALKRLVDAA